jgi:hypothetical protein
MQKLSDYSMKPIYKGGKTNKFVGVFLTVLVVGLIAFVGPVDAYSLQISGLKHTPYQVGETVNFLGKVNINNGEIASVKKINLKVNDQIVCVFDVQGNALVGCDGVDISLVSGNTKFGYGYGYNSFQKAWNGNYYSHNAGNYSGYGYGYGYGLGPGELVYNISIHTPQSYLHFGGNNRIQISTVTENQILDSKVELISLNPRMAGNENFLLGTDDAGAIFWGRFNSTDHTFAGEVEWLGNSAIRMVGVGTYEPKGPNSGKFTVQFYHPNVIDQGIIWKGTYSNGRWDMVDTEDPQITLTGRVFSGFN